MTSFKRIWDSSCPRVWDSWESAGVKWVISDLWPEDDDEGLNILVKYIFSEETLCTLSDIANDPASMRSMTYHWRKCLHERMSLGCYEERDGQRKLVGLNVCRVVSKEEDRHYAIEGRARHNVYGAIKLCHDKMDPFKILGVNQLLYAFGMVVCKEYRGAKLGSRILAARESLARSLNIKGTSSVFTSPASRICAERVGFETVLTLSLKELSEAGLDYPEDETRCIKVMVKKYE